MSSFTAMNYEYVLFVYDTSDFNVPFLCKYCEKEDGNRKKERKQD